MIACFNFMALRAPKSFVFTVVSIYSYYLKLCVLVNTCTYVQVPVEARGYQSFQGSMAWLLGIDPQSSGRIEQLIITEPSQSPASHVHPSSTDLDPAVSLGQLSIGKVHA